MGVILLVKIDQDRTKEAIIEAFRLFLHNEIKKQGLRIEKKQPVPYNTDNCNERSLVSEIEMGNDKCM